MSSVCIRAALVERLRRSPSNSVRAHRTPDRGFRRRSNRSCISSEELSTAVMAGLVPAIHAVKLDSTPHEEADNARPSVSRSGGLTAWMPGTRPGMTAVGSPRNCRYDPFHRARADLIDIYDFTEAAFGPYQAEAYHAGLERTFGVLADFPRIGPSVDELRPGYRRRTPFARIGRAIPSPRARGEG